MLRLAAPQTPNAGQLLDYLADYHPAITSPYTGRVELRCPISCRGMALIMNMNGDPDTSVGLAAGFGAFRGGVPRSDGPALSTLFTQRARHNDARERCGGVDDNAVFRNVFLCLMQSHNEFPFRLVSAPLSFHSFVKPPVQCVKIYFNDENAIK